MSTATPTLYEKRGGKEAIAKVVDNFYDQLLQDETVNIMDKAHQGMNLQPVHYDAVIKHLSDALRVFDLKDSDIHRVSEHLDKLKDDILYK